MDTPSQEFGLRAPGHKLWVQGRRGWHQGTGAALAGVPILTSAGDVKAGSRGLTENTGLEQGECCEPLRRASLGDSGALGRGVGRSGGKKGEKGKEGEVGRDNKGRIEGGRAMESERGAEGRVRERGWRAGGLPNYGLQVKSGLP